MEQNIIIGITCLLGVVSPAAFLYAFHKGLNRISWNASKKQQYWNRLLMGVMLWTILLFLTTIAGAYEYRIGDYLPRFLVGLFVPVLLMIIAQFRSSISDWIESIDIGTLIGVQFFRLFGAVFFLIAITGAGPKDFMSSGYGDVLTGALAIAVNLMYYSNNRYSKMGAWLFTLIGMLDLLCVSYILLKYYPTWSSAIPSTASAGSFPMMIVIGITAPIALLLHVFVIRKLIKNQ